MNGAGKGKNNFKLQTAKHQFLGFTWFQVSFEEYISGCSTSQDSSHQQDNRIFSRARYPY